MKQDINAVIEELENKYPLPRTEILEGIEQAFRITLSKRYGHQILVFLDDHSGQLEITAYINNSGDLDQRTIPLEKVRGFNTIKKHIERNLQKRMVFSDYDMLKPLEGEVYWGEIVRKDEHGVLHVAIETPGGLGVTAFCEKRYQPPHEREKYLPGDRRAFRVRKVEAIWLDGVPRVKVALDRTSKTLVEHLLTLKVEYILGEKVPLKCVRRISGGMSQVLVSKFIPKQAIKAVGEELGERIIVKLKGTEDAGAFQKDKSKPRVQSQTESPSPPSPGKAWDLDYDPLGEDPEDIKLCEEELGEISIDYDPLGD